jgi:hypothetical protein
MSRWNPYQPPENGTPPQETRISQLSAEPWPDGRRVRVSIEITPFLERPNLEVSITDENQQEVSSISIIETIDDRMTFTMHMRGQPSSSPYTLTARLQYPEIGTVHQESAVFTVEPQPPED